MSNSRSDRQSGDALPSGARSPFQVDRDRVLYSMPFRRLAGVTQVVSPGEGEIFHNRLTHSLKVAQIARRFAETLSKKHPKIAKTWGGLEPEVAEAAALAHDLGHPPFGHIAEQELDNLIGAEFPADGDNDLHETGTEGYEGNAQSFRIVTELAGRRLESSHALDLTRATLNAILKYPWKWGENPKKPEKYGAYECDTMAFEFARAGNRRPDAATFLTPSLEAQIMDWSDDIAYSVHDTEDFYRAGLIPLDRLAGGKERDRFQDEVENRADRDKIKIDKEFARIFRGLFDRVGVREPYAGTQEQRGLIYDFVSSNIDRFVTNTTLQARDSEGGRGVVYPPAIQLEVWFLKQLIWVYVIENPSLAAHQLGHRRAIRTLFEEFNSAVIEKKWELFPPFFRERARRLHEDRQKAGEMPPEERVRLVADTISSMTDRQAIMVYQQFTGVSPTSMLDPVLR
jgi:dGTPase